MDIGAIEQPVDQEVCPQMHPVGAVGLEQDGARHAAVFQERASVKPDIGADIEERVRPQSRATFDEIRQLALFGDFRRYFKRADTGWLEQEIRAEIMGDEIAPAVK
jgi:hypothetical protein